MRGRLRLLKSLVDNLPRYSALRDAILPGQAEWGTTEYLLLAVLRTLETQNHILITGLPVEGELPPPWPFRVPGEPPEPTKPRNRIKELAAWLIASQRG